MVDPDLESGWDRRRSVLLSRYERIAWELFASRGFGTVTVDDIAMAAGVSSRTIFRYFPTKEDLLLGFTCQGTTYLVSLINQLSPARTPCRPYGSCSVDIRWRILPMWTFDLVAESRS